MNSFVNFIIESGISLGLFVLLYQIFLQKETFFRMNRYFLLFAIIYSFLLPLIHLRIFDPIQNDSVLTNGQHYTVMLENVSVYGTNFSKNIADLISASNVILGLYLLGVLFFAVRFLIRIIQIGLIINRNKIKIENGIKLVTLDIEVNPFSFLSYVFVGNNLKELPGWEKVLTHECAHIRQRHTIDVLILEIFSIVQWFNPFFWVLYKRLKENHEYLADRAVLNQDGNKKLYRQVLLNHSIRRFFNVTNSFNYSLKKRIMMMSRLRSSRLSSIKVTSGVLLAVLLMLVFASEESEAYYNDFKLSKSITLPFNFDESLVPFNETEDYIAQQTEPLEESPIEKPESEKSVSDQTRETPETKTGQPDNQTSPIELQGDDSNEDIGVIQPVLNETAPSLENNFNDNTKPLDELALGGLEDATSKTNEEINIPIENENPMLNEETATDLAKTPKKEKEGSPVFVVVEEMPEFPGGQEALLKYLSKEVNYPVVAQEAGIEGQVLLNFIVDKDGSVAHTTVLHGVDDYLDKEALRVVNSLPKWKPGKQAGEPVAVSYTIPISFVLQ